MAGTKITQLTPSALPGQRYGSFAGKAAQVTPSGLIITIRLELASQYTEALELR